MRALFVVALLIGAVSAFDFKLPELNVDAKASVSPCGAVSASASTGLGGSTSVKIDAPELKIEKSEIAAPCADAPSVKKTSVSSSFSAKSSASASASARSSSSSSSSFSFSARRRFGPRRRIGGPCVTRVVSGCTTRQPCMRRSCVRAPCARRRTTFVRRARTASCGPRQAPTCFRPTADLLRGKDLEVQMLTVRGMEWKCEPIQQEQTPNEVVISPDPCPGLPCQRIIERACDKVVE